MVGVTFAWLGSIILFIGKRQDVSLASLMRKGHGVYGELDIYFRPKYVFYFKFFVYIGLVLLLAGIFKMF